MPLRHDRENDKMFYRHDHLHSSSFLIGLSWRLFSHLFNRSKVSWRRDFPARRSALRCRIRNKFFCALSAERYAKISSGFWLGIQSESSSLHTTSRVVESPFATSEPYLTFFYLKATNVVVVKNFLVWFYAHQPSILSDASCLLHFYNFNDKSTHPCRRLQ